MKQARFFRACFLFERTLTELPPYDHDDHAVSAFKR